MLKEDKSDKRKERHKITQEDFTPSCVVDNMLSQLPNNTFTTASKTVLDNSCGIGNFLVEVLRRKLSNCTTYENAIKALRSIYGVELMADNVEECRNRLYQLFLSYYPNISNDYKQDFKVRGIIRNRIQWHDSLTFDYDHWPKMHTVPDSKHMNVSFEERFKNDTYPMWSETKMESKSKSKSDTKCKFAPGTQISIFDVIEGRI